MDDISLIETRLYSVAEVARLIGHRAEYVRCLINSRTLEGVRLAGPDGAEGQWRIRPDSLRRYLGIASSN